MKKSCFLFACIFILNLNAQKTISSDSVTAVALPKMNIIKTNVTAYAFRNINLTYERSLNKWFSLTAGFGIVPEGKIPFLKTILGNDNNSKIQNLEIKASNFTIESRFYLGKGYGKGFYIAPYYRYTKINTNTFDFDYNYQPTNGAEIPIPLKAFGNTTGNSGGLMIGAQFFLNKKQNFVLDFWIAGAHYGAGKGDFELSTNQTLTPEMQAQLKKEIEDLDIPYIKYTVETNPHGAKIKLDGPWAGLRSGLSLGYRF